MRRPPLHDEVWESLGSTDPDWAVLTDPHRRHGGWTEDLDAFYATGRADVAEVLASLPDDSFVRVLDWGSGTGRLTFALLEHAEEVTAVDISRGMLATLTARARDLHLDGRVDPVHVDDLRPAGDHDLALSLLVLQHLGSRAGIRAALERMVGCLHVGGLLVIEVPDLALTVRARVQPRFRVYQALRSLGFSPGTLSRHGLSGISMCCLSEDVVRHELGWLGVQTLSVSRRQDEGHRYARYVGRRVR